MTINKKIFIGIVALLPLVFFLWLPQTANAASNYVEYNPGWEVIPSECLDKYGDCNPDSFVQLFVNLAGMMIKILPTLAMLMLIIGGLAFISSAGNPEKVQKGKKIITTVVLGVILIIGVGWALSYFIVTTLTGEESGKIFGSVTWWAPQGGENGSNVPAGSGCCQVTNYGCQKNTTAQECDALDVTFDAAKGVDVAVFWQEGDSCGSINNCLNYAASFKCCVPDDIFDLTCFTPNENGCLDWPHTSANTEKTCGQLVQCQPL